jgi:hypothetical protein
VLDVESLSHLCKLLYTVAEGLDIIALHVKVSDLIFYALVFLEDYDCETVGAYLSFSPRHSHDTLHEQVIHRLRSLTSEMLCCSFSPR